jgi:hypothetical protein
MEKLGIMRAEAGGDGYIQLAAGRRCREPRDTFAGGYNLSREASPLAVWLEDGIQTQAQGDDVVSIARKPGMHPHRPIKKSLRRPICMSNSNAHY